MGRIGNTNIPPPHPNLFPHIKPLTYPNYGARILYEGSTITNKLHPLMAQSLHCQTLVLHIIKKNKWNESIFCLIHWDAHEMVFKCLARSRQITTAKLIHDLTNTVSEENGNQALKELQKDLKHIDTPSKVVEALSHGITMWLHQQNDPECVI